MRTVATLAVTYTVGTNAGAQLRHVAEKLCETASNLDDICSTGASVVVTFNNAPATGTIGWTIAGGSLPATLTYQV